jgi:hypothetical protein
MSKDRKTFYRGTPTTWYARRRPLANRRAADVRLDCSRGYLVVDLAAQVELES